MSQSTITFLVLAAVVVVFVLDRLPVAVVAVGTSLALWATGVLDLDQALAGFGDPAVLFIAALFVVSESLDATGVTAWAGQELVEHVGQGRAKLLVLMLLGIPLVAGTIAAVVFFGERLLPDRPVRAGSRDFSEHARTLVDQYGLDGDPELLTRRSGVAEIVIPPRSQLVGDAAFPGMVTESGDLVVLAVQRKGTWPRR